MVDRTTLCRLAFNRRSLVDSLGQERLVQRLHCLQVRSCDLLCFCEDEDMSKVVATAPGAVHAPE